MSVRLLTEHHFEFLSLKGGCTGSSESSLVKMPHVWKSHVVAHIIMSLLPYRGIRPTPLHRGSYMSAHVLLNLLN